MRDRCWFTLLITILVAWGLAFNVSAKIPEPGQPLAEVPDALIDPGSGKEQYVLVVEKASQRLFLYEFKNENYYLMQTFLCTSGENVGDKQAEGDKKTPEGFYLFNKKSLEAELAPIYGVMAFPMDYPNFWDRKLGKGGSGIWLHGSDKPRVPRDSNGCIALDNFDLVELEPFIKLYDTPIVIYDTITYKNPKAIQQEADRIKTFIEEWRESWQRKDLERYRSLYARDFISDDGKDYSAWMAHKANLYEKYKVIRVNVEDLRLFRHQGLVVAIFDQHYKGDSNFDSNGVKRLYLRETGRGYEILAEEWRPYPQKEPSRFLAEDIKRRIQALGRLTPEKYAALKEKEEKEKAQAMALAEAEAKKTQALAEAEAQKNQAQVEAGKKQTPPPVQVAASAPLKETPRVAPAPAPRPETAPVVASAPVAPAPAPRTEPVPTLASQAPVRQPQPKTTTAKPSSTSISDAGKFVEMDNIRRMLEDWLYAWQRGDIDTYIRYYSSDFRFKDMDREAYRQYKIGLANKYREIYIGVDQLNIQVEGPSAQVTYVQEYEADNYRDFGLKILTLSKRNGHWYIGQESWQDMSAGAKP